MSVTIAMSLNLKGLSSPLPIVKTAKAMKDLEPGEVVEVLTTEPSSVADFKAWAQASGNRLIDFDQHGGVYRLILKKNEF